MLQQIHWHSSVHNPSSKQSVSSKCMYLSIFEQVVISDDFCIRENRSTMTKPSWPTVWLQYLLKHKSQNQDYVYHCLCKTWHDDGTFTRYLTYNQSSSRRTKGSTSNLFYLRQEYSSICALNTLKCTCRYIEPEACVRVCVCACVCVCMCVRVSHVFY